MANPRWTGEKVKELVGAIESKDYATIDYLIEVEGDGQFPDKGYGRGDLRYGPNTILSKCIWTDDIDLLDHLLSLGMHITSMSERDGGMAGIEMDVLFGGWRGNRNPEILRRLADNGYDFSGMYRSGVTNLRSFVCNNSDDIDLFRSLESAGLSYWKDVFLPDQSDDGYRRKYWCWCDTIPWEDLLCGEHFELVEHFLDAGYKPEKPLRLQVGAVPPRNYDAGPHIQSSRTVEFICDKGLPLGDLLLSEVLEPSTKAVLISCIENGLSFYNPDALFRMLDYEVIEAALSIGSYELKPEYIGPAQAAGRKDLLELYGKYGADARDVTAQLVDELETLLLSAEHTDGYIKQEIVDLAKKPKGELETLKALREDAVADWKTVTGLLARLYCAPFAYPLGQKSCRPSSLKKMAGKSTWEEVFKKCLTKFDGPLDIKLLLPMPSISLDSYKNHPNGFGIGFWYDEDVAVYRLLSERGAEFLCKIKRSGGYSEWNPRNIEGNRDARPGDVFIWLAPDVSDFLFEKRGWSTGYLPVSYVPSRGSNRQLVHPLGWHLLDFLLLESGNAYAYKWFIEHAADVKEFKKPALKDVIDTPLLRPFLENKKDGSIRSKDAVNLVAKTIKGPFCADTALLVRKLSLTGEAASQIRERLSDIKTRSKQPYVDETLALIDARGSQPKPAKKAAPKKPTVPQLVTLVADALDEGDGTKVAELEPIAAKVPMADCVELLERAAANCDGETVDRLFELFSPFECLSSALLVALFSGNVSTARALVAHGADLIGKLLYIDEKRTPRKGRPAREKRYSHGLIGQRYSAGGTVAYGLGEALTKDDGTIVSRTKTTVTWSRKTVKRRVNDTSRTKAADTLLSVSHEEGFTKSIAIRLLWNPISFDGRRTSDACFDAPNARKILSAYILSKEETAEFPWGDAVDAYYAIGRAKSSETKEWVRLVKDYASKEDFIRCWRPEFAKRDERSGKYEQIGVLLLFLNDLDSENCGNQLQVLTALAETGKLRELRRLANKPGWFTKQRTKRLIDVASASNQTEMTAWLLQLSHS